MYSISLIQLAEHVHWSDCDRTMPPCCKYYIYIFHSILSFNFNILANMTLIVYRYIYIGIYVMASEEYRRNTKKHKGNILIPPIFFGSHKIYNYISFQIPSARSLSGLIVPNFCMGFSIGKNS